MQILKCDVNDARLPDHELTPTDFLNLTPGDKTKFGSCLEPVMHFTSLILGNLNIVFPKRLPTGLDRDNLSPTHRQRIDKPKKVRAKSSSRVCLIWNPSLDHRDIIPKVSKVPD